MNKLIFKPNDVWIVIHDGDGKQFDAIAPRWWHKLMFWKKWRYAIDRWFINREYKSLKEMME